jgi:WhiB family redox-sensing transcriptional regulator
MNPALTTWLMAPEVLDEPLVLEDFLQRPAWRRRAACKGQRTDAFFPGRGQSTHAAKAVCVGCAVRQDCLEYALADPDLDGVWAGLTTKERRVMRRAVT